MTLCVRVLLNFEFLGDGWNGEEDWLPPPRDHSQAGVLVCIYPTIISTCPRPVSYMYFSRP